MPIILCWGVFARKPENYDIWNDMKTADNIRNRLIDKILAIQNTDFLKALDNLVSTSAQADTVQLTKEQKEMLKMSESNISAGKLISQDKLDFEDKEWLRNQ